MMTGRYWKLLLGSIWACGFLLVLGLWLQADIPLRETPQALERMLREFGLYRAAFCYIILYTVRPLILFPATLLTISSGLLFGP